MLPGRDDEPAELVRERHQQHAADTRLEVLLGQVGLAAGEGVGQRLASKRSTTGSIGSSRKSVPRFSASRRASPRVSSEEKRDGIETQWTRSGPSASHASAAVSAESIPPETPMTTSLEPVLVDVVAQPELEREPHLLEVVRQRRDRRLTGSSRGRGVPMSTIGTAGQLLALARERAPAHVAQPPPDAACGSTSTTSSASSNPGRAREHLALVVEDDGVAVEDSSSCPPTALHERDEADVVAGARWKHLLALAVLADVERRGRDVDEQLRAREREVGRGRARLPDVLADRRADQRVAELEQDEVAAGREVAVLVEDAVVREEALAVDRLHLAARADGARVVEVAVEVRRADERDDAARRRCDLARASARLRGRSPGAGAGPRADSR